MDYKTALQYIEDKNKLGIVPGLDSIKELLRRLGNPENGCKAMHIAGTNGKGSVFAFVESALVSAGYKVGRYISPTIFTYLERFQINMEFMDEKTFAELMTIVSKKISEMEKEGWKSPTAFEIETAVAFLYFFNEKCDYILLECGMGGMLDATNVIASPEVSVMARISMDHMQYLGDTIEEIAINKSGIIKDKSVCVSTVQRKEVFEILKNVCKNHDTEFITVDETELNIISEDMEKSVFKYKGQIYKISLIGEHQILNAATAIEALKTVNISEEYIKEGLAKTIWKGRMTKVCDKPLTYVDGAHNEEAWMVLKHNINKYFTNKRIIYIIGVLKDKEYNKMIDILCDTMEYAITITPDSPRGLDGKILADIISEKGVKADAADDAEDALRKASCYINYNKADEYMILVCGSLSFISDYMVN